MHSGRVAGTLRLAMQRTLAAALVLAALLAAACGSPSGTSAGPAGSAATSGASSAAASTPGEPASPAPGESRPPASAAPGETAAPTASTAPAGSGAPSGSAEPSASAVPGGADACSGNDANRAFYANLARSVSWQVFCAVLPKGWFVSSGLYRLANGGKLLISYKGPGGATLSLSEGAFCADGSGCVPAGSDAGDAAFGSLSGTLVTVDAGGFAIVAARGQTPSWLMVTQGLDQATTVSLGAALAEVAG
jgi:hypothetical protein